MEQMTIKLHTYQGNNKIILFNPVNGDEISININTFHDYNTFLEALSIIINSIQKGGCIPLYSI